MCNPIALAAVAGGMQIGQQVLQYQGQQQAYAANKTAANLNYANRITTIGEQKAQLDEKQSQTKFDEAIQAAKSEGSVINSASTMGLAPSSLVHALNTTDFGLGQTSSVEDINDRNARLQLGNEATGAEIARQSQINSVTNPSPLSLILGIGKAGADAGSSYYQMTG